MFDREENLRNIEKAWKNQPFKVVNNQFNNFNNFKSKLDCFLLTAPHFFLLFNFVESKVFETTAGIEQLFDVPKDDFSVDKMLELMHPEDAVRFIESEKASMNFWKNTIPTELWGEYRHQVNFRVKYKGAYRHILMQSIILDREQTGGVINKIVCFTDYTNVGVDMKMETHAISLFDSHKSYYNISNNALTHIEKTITPNIQLSAREHDVLTLISYGKSSKEISEILHLSKNTIDNHRKNMLLKNPVSNITELVRVAVKTNII